jgi:uncharacterized Tic20 family protein
MGADDRPQGRYADERYPDERYVDEPPVKLTNEERTWGMLCHLSALGGLLVGGLTFLGPLICWLVKKDTSRFVDHNGKESLNFHLNILGYYLIGVAITAVTCGVGAIVAVPLMIAVHVYGIVMTVIASTRANSGEYYRYPAIVRIIT